jgi:leucyl/phenylalanyl-tRNA---protein transferase
MTNASSAPNSMTLTPDILINAYCQGVFPMAEDDGSIYWYDPDPRAILPLDGLHVSRSLKRRIRQGGFVVKFNTAFREVMIECARPAPGRVKTWISKGFIEVYGQLHRLGFAHSIEIWIENKLAGGIYGVGIGGLFAGESMFSRVTGASKIALVYLVRHLQEQNFRLFDIQFTTAHLMGFGAVDIPQCEYKSRLAQALKVGARF